MIEPGKYPTLEAASLGDIKMRLALITKVIEEGQRDGDERWRGLIEDQQVLNEFHAMKMKEYRRERGIPEPEPIVIGCQPARLRAHRPGK